MHRFVRSSVLALALLAVTATATFAHECFVANRGSTGSQQAGQNSSSWEYLNLEMIAGFVDPDHPLTPAQVDVFVAEAEARGVPYEFALFVGGRPNHENPEEGGFTLAANKGFTKNGKGADGSGIEHLFAAHFENIVEAYSIALGTSSGD